MSAISFLAGLGAGYMDRGDKNRREARQDRLDQITFDRAGRETTEYNQNQRDRGTLRAAAAPLPVDTVSGMGPPADDGSVGPETYRVGAQKFADRGVADQAASDPTASNARVAAAMRGIDPLKAQELDRNMKQGELADVQLKAQIQRAKDEGTGRALNMALSLGASGAEQVKAAYNANGKEKITNLQITPIEVEHPVLGKQKSVKITGTTAEGQPFEIPDALDASFKLFSAEKQFDMLSRAKEKDAANKHQTDVLDETKRYHTATINDRTEKNAMRIEMAGMRAAASRGAGGAPAEANVATADSTFDRKTAADIAKDTVKKEAEQAAGEGKPLSGATMAKRADEIVSAMYATHQNRFVATQVSRVLSAAQADPAAYAAQYEKAAKIMPPQALDGMGFKPPAAPQGGAARAAAGGIVPAPITPAAARQPADPEIAALESTMNNPSLSRAQRIAARDELARRVRAMQDARASRAALPQGTDAMSVAP